MMQVTSMWMLINNAHGGCLVVASSFRQPHGGLRGAAQMLPLKEKHKAGCGSAIPMLAVGKQLHMVYCSGVSWA